MKRIVILLVFLFYSILNFAQIVNLEIRILDSAKNIPVPNANIELSNLFTTSNNSGESFFNNIPTGNYLLKISHISYKSITDNIYLSNDTTINIMLTPTSIKLNEVMVISGKYEKEINLLPYSIALVNSNDIRQNPAQTVSDLLKSESGISLLRDGIWGTEISIRGLNRSNIVTLIDGDRIETSTDISARLSMIDLNDVERIEVIKGAVSSLYGSGATGGIVNIISKTGSYNNKFTFNGNYLSGYNSVNDFFSNGINLFASDKNWLAKISGAFRKAGNTKTPSGELQNSQFDDNSINALALYKPFENHEIKINYQQFKAINVGIPGASSVFTANAKVSYPEELRRLYNIEYKINNISSSFLKLTAKYFHQFISRDVENIPGIVQYVAATNGQPPKRVSVLKISPGADHNVDGFQTQADFSFTNHYLIAGFDFWKRNYNGLRSKDQKIEVLNPSDSSVVNTIYKTIYEKPLPDADFYSAGIYLQDECKLSEKINLTLGGRYDFIWLHNSETANPLYDVTNGTVNYSPAGQTIIWDSESAQNKSYVFNIGLLYSFNSNANIAFNAANSFRSPSLEERYQYIDLGSVIRVGDPNLKPEQGYFFDLGFRFFPDNINFRTSVFLNSFTDLVTEEPGIYDGRDALIKVNIGKALLYGFEYSLNLSLVDKISLYNTLSYVRGINKNNDSDLPQISPLNGILGFKYFLYDWVSADFSAVVFNAQNKVAEDEKTTPGYAIFNLGINFMNISVETFHLQVNAGIENIFNKEYRNHLSTNRGLIISEPGRNFYIRTNISF
ncbi:MAG: TonB-dependent receptor [Ignavibacteriaceae bacterium]